MRTWLILRHAQAQAQSASGEDADRVLTEKGEEDAISAGEWIWENNITIDRVISSPASRARRTAELVTEYARAPIPEMVADIYHATPGTLMQLLDEAGKGTTLLIGHNPGVEQLLALLVEGRSGEFRGMPTTGLACLEIPVDSQAEPGAARMRSFWSPGV